VTSVSRSPTAASPLSVCLQLTHAISRTSRLQDVFEAALNALESGVRVSRAAILLFDPDGVMRFKASRGLSPAYRKAVEGHTPWARHSRDVEPIVVPNVKCDESLAPILPTLQAEGIAALAFIPLEGALGVIGKFMVYHHRPRVLSTSQQELAVLIAAQVAFAVERIQAYEAAKASDDRLWFALESANMGTWDWNLATNEVQWSNNLERIHGLAPGSFDRSFASYEREIHPDDRARVRASIERALSQGVAHDVEYRIVAPDGTVRWVEGKGRVDYDADSRPLRMTGVCMNVTPRKAIELERIDVLEESNRTSQRLAAIVESSDDAIVSKNLDGIIASWNEGAERMFGYRAAEAIGQSILLIVPPDRRLEEDAVLASIRSGHSVEMETVRRHKSGAFIDISLKVSPVKDTAGRIVGAAKIARDITARKRGEAERAELYRRLMLLVVASTSLLDSPETESVRGATVSLAEQLLAADGHALWTRDADALDWRVVKAQGLSPEFVVRAAEAHRNGSEHAPPLFVSSRVVHDVENDPGLTECVSVYLDEGIASMLVCPMRIAGARAGALVFYCRAQRAFSDMDVQTGQALANLAGAALTTAELYEEQRTQRQSAESARRQAAFLADATAVLSRSLDYRQTLAAVARLAVPEIADWCTIDIMEDGQLRRLAVAHVDPAKAEYARALEQRYPPDPKVSDIYTVLRTGKPAMVAAVSPDFLASRVSSDEHLQIVTELGISSYMCLPIVSSGGTLGVMTFVLAGSSRHYTERELALGQEVAARAALAIDNAVAYRQAHEANRVKDEFLATLSHELRTPLNAILGYSQMLNTGVLNGDRQSKALSVVLRNAEALRQIIDDVLDVSRITSGKLRLNVRSVDLSEVLRNAVATVQPAAEAKGVSVQVVLDSEAPPVCGDPDRLQQVIWNLLSNAMKFTPRGGHVQLRLEPVDSAVQIVVSDDGQGIDPEFLPHIFERFRQADSRFSREHGGLGLGLAIVRDLVHLHGGTVSASSDGPGTGATFVVRIPPMLAHQAAANAESAVPPPAGVRTSQGVPARLKGVHILAVDDEEDALGLMKVILESAGAEVTTAASARRALDLLQTTPFDAVIADIGMPRMDGLDLIRNVRRTLPSPANRVPAAALTAYARAEDRVTALASGFQMHMAKPVNPTELVIAVAAMLGR
jgi:PAS domain S-box-containing protein